MEAMISNLVAREVAIRQMKWCRMQKKIEFEFVHYLI